MTCGTACAQTTADTAMAAYEKGKPYTRYEIMNALYLDGGSALYLVSDQLIPDAEKTVRTPYGETLPVLHLKRKHCTEDGVTLHKADWAGVGPGTYLEAEWSSRLLSGTIKARKCKSGSEKNRANQAR